MDRVHHIALAVPDIGEALAWYHDHFDVETIYEDSSWALLRLDNIALALVLPDQHPPHIAIERRNAETFGELTAHRDGTSSVYVDDPWGNTIEIMKTVA
jgi:catechol 2,3-dioxygenase-like lactoylglutathione lyase family enzyme